MLTDEGTPVSAATLSYWQSGRSLPSKQRSLAAVAVLERALHLDRGALTTLLPLPDTLEPSSSEAPASHTDPWNVVAETSAITQRAAQAVSSSLAHEPFRRLSTHVEVEFDASGALRGYNRRFTLAATEDDVDRMVVWMGLTVDDSYLVSRPVYNCRLGRSVRQEGGHATEWIFDRPLRAGEVTVVENRCEVIGASTREVEALQGVLGDLGELVMDVRFDEACLPTSITRYSAVQDGETSSPATVMDRHATAVFLRPEEGHHGLRWEW